MTTTATTVTDLLNVLLVDLSAGVGEDDVLEILPSAGEFGFRSLLFLAGMPRELEWGDIMMRGQIPIWHFGASSCRGGHSNGALGFILQFVLYYFAPTYLILTVLAVQIFCPARVSGTFRFLYTTLQCTPAGQPLSAAAGAALSLCATASEQYALLKRSYFRLVRLAHPDRGGDAATFRRVQHAFRAVRYLYERDPAAGFTDPAVLRAAFPGEEGNGGSDGSNATAGTGASPVQQPWEYYESAASATEPPYKVEPAKSGNAKCNQPSAKYRRCTQIYETRTDKKTGESQAVLVNPKIAEGELRVGWYNDKIGSYGQWVHLEVRRPIYLHYRGYAAILLGIIPLVVHILYDEVMLDVMAGAVGMYARPYVYIHHMVGQQYM